ncbi:hypothetical protein BIU82_13710 [Arthrobacter sp. SW1]|uniref:hypothetical protein n=1 Tax=Arthrobacter sp. SW1 TaxID=1920889 RepID=UPI000877D249|nr:hypothetical protein [Arthrobacter sp. SW1]OFI36545.1 hypothetical protein BIU82_13710 [Arthrobacter sp. SW1]
MDFALGDVLILVAPVAILGLVVWALSQALKPRDFGISEAERYQRELAQRSAAHQARQVQAALAARARTTAANHAPSQTQQPQRPAPAAVPASGSPAGGAPSAGASAPGGRQLPPAVLPNGQLNPDFARQLQSMARNGQKLQAIKLLRDYTRADLLSAKNYIDRL